MRIRSDIVQSSVLNMQEFKRNHGLERQESSMPTCSLCYGKGYIYHSHQEEYDVEVCPCQQIKELKDETN